MSIPKKILLNYIPPIRNVYPSAGLSILKSFLEINGWQTEVKYWNILMDDLMTDFPYNDKRNLIPFLYILANIYQNTASKQKIITYLIQEKPSFLNGNRLEIEKYLEKTQTTIYKIIDDEFAEIDFENIHLFGLSLKFYQFIPGIIFAQELKKCHPHIKIVIGGIRNVHTAREYMEMCDEFDFAIWGEGEYPLLDLCNEIENNSSNFESIARLAYRENNEIKTSKISKGKFLDFKNYIFPDYSDYPIINKSDIVFPVNSIRSCYWDKCKFCIFGDDYVYRERCPESIANEIEFIFRKYQITHIHFIDNDIIGTNVKRFVSLLDRLIELSEQLNIKFTFWGEIIHKNLNEEIFQKMALAGFTSANFGLEAISDSLLKKMDKRTNFADNIFAIKSCLRFKIIPGGNIIYNLPDESAEDISESIFNMHFLRFYFNDKTHPLSLQARDFVLQKGTHYYSQITADEIEEHNINAIAFLVPEKFLENRNRFNLFGYNRKTLHSKEWDEFKILEKYYKKAKYQYSITQNENQILFSETKNNKLILSLNLDIIQQEILKILNQKVFSLANLLSKITPKFPDITETILIEKIYFLKEKFIVYSNTDYTSITSVITF